MTLGEKIQQLRKTKNLSQEQLAEKLNVSRQAVSKWEIGESLPDINKIIQLSKIFQVSTDYLLYDEIDSDMNIPAVKNSNDSLKNQYGMKTLFIVTTGTIIIGLIMSIVAQFTWQTPFSISIGFIVQIISIMIIESLKDRYATEEGNQLTRKKFYALNVWFILPFPIIILSDIIFRFIPWSYSVIEKALFKAVFYFIICGITTFILKKNSKID
ncbi:helix-turn-helix domain-containing protein [Clostridium sp. Marseille-QA1073]